MKTPGTIVLLTALAVILGGAFGWGLYGLWPEMSIHGYIALGLGVALSLGVGVGLMALVFYSARQGYDDRQGSD